MAMLLKDWRTLTGKSQGECARLLNMEGGARTFQRVETGSNKPDADIVERIAVMTGGDVSAADMHATRLSWLRVNRPEKFVDRDRPAGVPWPGDVARPHTEAAE